MLSDLVGSLFWGSAIGMSGGEAIQVMWRKAGEINKVGGKAYYSGLLIL